MSLIILVAQVYKILKSARLMHSVVANIVVQEFALLVLVEILSWLLYLMISPLILQCI